MGKATKKDATTSSQLNLIIQIYTGSDFRKYPKK